MIISELIEELKKYPPDLRVVISGKEEGYDDIEEFIIIEKCILNYHNNAWYEGAHRDVDLLFGDEMTETDKENIVKVLSIC